MSPAFAIGPLTVLELAGNDRVQIANNLCTQDLRAMDEGDVRETFVTDVKGRTLCHGLIVACRDCTWLITAPGRGTALAAHFDRYIFREDARVTDASDRWLAYLFLDDASLRDSARVAMDLPFDDPRFDRACWSIGDGTEFGLGLRCNWVRGGGLLLLPARPGSPDRFQPLRAQCQSSDTAHRVGWERARIDAFWPWDGVDFDEKNLPQELDIDDRAISFKKGCYLGQETVARLDALGQVQKKLVCVTIHGHMPLSLPATIAVDGKDVGTVTSAAMRDDETQSGLAMVRRSHFAPGTEFVLGNHRVVIERAADRTDNHL